MTRGTAPLNATGHKATLPRLGDGTALLIRRNKHRKAAKMERKRNMPPMKEQEESPEKELNKMEESNLPVTEFKNIALAEVAQ